MNLNKMTIEDVQVSGKKGTGSLRFQRTRWMQRAKRSRMRTRINAALPTIQLSARSQRRR